MSGEIHRLETGYQPKPPASPAAPKPLVSKSALAKIKKEILHETAALMASAAKTIEDQHAWLQTMKGIFELIERHDFPSLHQESPEIANRLKAAARR